MKQRIMSEIINSTIIDNIINRNNSTEIRNEQKKSQSSLISNRKERNVHESIFA